MPLPDYLNESSTAFNERSSSIEEIISKPPTWLVSWGNTVFLAIVVIFIIIGYIIRYPDIVSAPFKLTTESSPKSIISRVDSKVVRLFVHNNSAVNKGAVLAYLESTADHAEVLKLSEDLKFIMKSIQTNHELPLPKLRMANYFNLGELQPDFQTFTGTYLKYKSYITDGFYQKKLQMLEKDLRDLKSENQNIKSKKVILERDYEISVEEYNVNKQLAKEKVIAPLELKRLESTLLAKKIPLQELNSDLLKNEVEQNATEKDILDLNDQVIQQKQLFLQSINTLTSNVDAWSKIHILRSPLTGKIAFSTFIQENQNINENQELFFVTPFSDNYLGEMTVSQYNLGKVTQGQTVLIKFDSYPSEEFGSVLGKISSIADIPDTNGNYLVKVSLNGGLKTNYNKSLVYRNGLQAKGEIITDNKRLIERLLYSLRNLISR